MTVTFMWKYYGNFFPRLIFFNFFILSFFKIVIRDGTIVEKNKNRFHLYKTQAENNFIE